MGLMRSLHAFQPLHRQNNLNFERHYFTKQKTIFLKNKANCILCGFMILINFFLFGQLLLKLSRGFQLPISVLGFIIYYILYILGERKREGRRTLKARNLVFPQQVLESWFFFLKGRSCGKYCSEDLLSSTPHVF